MRDVPIPGLLAIIVGVLIILLPDLLNYLLGLYLIVTGVLLVVKRRG